MAASISAVVLRGIVGFVLIRSGSVQILPALACAGVGLFLACTGAAPLITDTIGTVTALISEI